MTDVVARYSSRKFVFSLLVVLLASWLLHAGSIDSDVWLKVVSACVLGYLGANVAQKATAKTAVL